MIGKRLWINNEREAGAGHFETNKELERRLRVEKSLDKLKENKK